MFHERKGETQCADRNGARAERPNTGRTDQYCKVKILLANPEPSTHGRGSKTMSSPLRAKPACDGVGEMWFESDEAMQSALTSPAMAAAVEDAKNFLDMEKTGLVIVEEKTVVG